MLSELKRYLRELVEALELQVRRCEAEALTNPGRAATLASEAVGSANAIAALLLFARDNVRQLRAWAELGVVRVNALRDRARRARSVAWQVAAPEAEAQQPAPAAAAAVDPADAPAPDRCPGCNADVAGGELHVSGCPAAASAAS